MHAKIDSIGVRLPHGALLTQLVVGSTESVRGSADDPQNYFYTLKHLDEWLPRNVVGQAVCGSGFTQYGYEGEKCIWSFYVSFVWVF